MRSAGAPPSSPQEFCPHNALVYILYILEKKRKEKKRKEKKKKKLM
jgi:hypothetical protein